MKLIHAAFHHTSFHPFNTQKEVKHTWLSRKEAGSLDCMTVPVVDRSKVVPWKACTIVICVLVSRLMCEFPLTLKHKSYSLLSVTALGHIDSM